MGPGGGGTEDAGEGEQTGGGGEAANRDHQRKKNIFSYS